MTTIIVPAMSDDQISRDLRWLTERLMAAGADTTGGILGGEFGYGADYENDTFVMFPFYWGDCECGYSHREWQWDTEHNHADGCYQVEIRRRGFLDGGQATNMGFAERDAINTRVIGEVCAEMGLDPLYGSWVHCTCDYQPSWERWQAENRHLKWCPIERPNFEHKASGSVVRWYKYIGRDMEVDLRQEWRSILEECVTSIS